MTSIFISAAVFDGPRVVIEKASLHQKMSEECDNPDFKLVEQHVKKVIKCSQNCFNWVRTKLASIDIEIGEHSTEWLAPIPQTYFAARRREIKEG